MKSAPTLTFISSQSATTYLFRCVDGFGWANCTINDATGELAIQSDWGSWSYGWSPNPAHLGAPSLTAFIGSRGGVDYLACKLQRERNAGRRWSAVATTQGLQRALLARRLKDGREQLAYRLSPEDMSDGQPLQHLRGSYTTEGLPINSRQMRVQCPYERLEFLTKDEARRIWEELRFESGLADEVGSSDLYYDRVLRIDGFIEYVTEHPWEYGETEQTSEDRALREVILPALITVCQEQFIGETSWSQSG